MEKSLYKSDYHFLSVWHFDVPIEQVWEAIFRSVNWPKWWKGVSRAEFIKKGVSEDGVGSIVRSTWKGVLPYHITFDVLITRVSKYEMIEGEASGELSGTGTWCFSQAGGVTTVTYEWDVILTNFWMRMLSPIFRPLFIWNHDIVMKRGEKGLRQYLQI